MTKRNPKQEGSNMFDCRPQTGSCPMNCNQCFYNRPGAFYVDINEPNIPDPEEVGDRVVRMNCGHDSNLQRDLVIETAKKYKHFFFNTSIPKFDFPGPVVFTANPMEEEFVYALGAGPMERKIKYTFQKPENIMFVRLRVSPTNLYLVENAVKSWTKYKISVVLTFMAYYDQTPPGTVAIGDTKCGWIESQSIQEVEEKGHSTTAELRSAYQWKVRHINSYWCPTREFMVYVLKRMKKMGGRLVTMCGTLDSNYCRDCRNCEIYYWQSLKHMKEIDDGIFDRR